MQKEKTMRENQYQAGLKKRLKSMFPGCLVTKLDSSDIQGIPDLLILYKNKWAILEVKKDAEAQNTEPVFRLKKCGMKARLSRGQFHSSASLGNLRSAGRAEPVNGHEFPF